MKKRRLQRNTENGNGAVLTPEEEALLHDLSGVSHVDKPLPPPLVLPGIPAADADTEPDAPGDGETEEDALLRALLQSAYPAPPENLRRDVMAKIGVMTRKRKMRRTILRWGSAAACFVMICSLALVASPMLRKSSAATEMALNGAQPAVVSDTAAQEAETGAADPDAYETAAVVLPESPEGEEAPSDAAVPDTEAEIEVEKVTDTTCDADEKPHGGSTSGKNNGSSNAGTGSGKNNSSNAGTNSGKNNGSSNAGTGSGKNNSSSNAGTDSGKNNGSSNAGTGSGKNNSSSNAGTDSGKNTATSGGAANKQETSASTTETEPPRRFLNPGGAQITTDGAAETSAETGSTVGNPGAVSGSTSGSTGGSASNTTSASNSTSGSVHSRPPVPPLLMDDPTASGADHGSNAAGNATDTVSEDAVPAVEDGTAIPEDATDVNTDSLTPVLSLMGGMANAAADDTADDTEMETELSPDALTESKMEAKNTVDPVFVAQNQVKWALISYIAPEKYAKWMTEHGYQTASDFTLAELVRDMQISHETFHAIVSMLGLERTIDEKLYFSTYDDPASTSANNCQNAYENRICMENAAIRNSVK